MIWDFQKYRSDIAILDEYGMSLTYGGLYEEGRRLQEAIGRRCLAFVLCRNETGALAGYTGMLNGGIVPVLLTGYTAISGIRFPGHPISSGITESG